MVALGTGSELLIRIDPALAEVVVFRALSHPELIAPERVAGHRRRIDLLYSSSEPFGRDAAFGRLAVEEFEALDLFRPIRQALAERPALAATVRVVLLGSANGRLEEGVTCEPAGARLGIRVESRRFDDPGSLLAWARHALGHGEDTLDPVFDFDPGWEEAVRRRLGSVTIGRLHRLWDVTVDSHLSKAGRLVAEPALGRHRAAIATDLPGVASPAIGHVVEYLWEGPRPTFPTLRAWAERPLELLRVAAPGEAARLRPDRCPLCGFPSPDVIQPDTRVAALVSAAYPEWCPEDGLCGRCTDRFRFAGCLGGPR